jgi:3-dehydroquinate dehydratase-2
MSASGMDDAMQLRALREGDAPWRIVVLNGPNVGRMLAAVDGFDAQLAAWGASLGVQVEQFTSNHEGRLLEHIHATSAATHGYLVNPGGLTVIGESLRHALRDAKRPHVEVHLDNRELSGQTSIFAPSVTGIVSGLEQYSYLGALVALVLALDDPSFLQPDSTDPISRPHGAPRSLYG